MRETNSLLLACLGLALAPVAAQAVIVYGDPTATGDVPANHRNLSAPTGTYANSGWQYEVTFGSGSNAYTGTAIAPNYFITAKHVAPGAGTLVTMRNGESHQVVSGQQIGSTDLWVSKIDGSFSASASLYREAIDGSLTNKALVVYGRGVAPGAAVTTGSVKNGWQWGEVDGAMSWGTNQVDGKTLLTVGPSQGLTLRFSASDTAGITEGTVVDKDSGGGVFVQGALGEWKLAGVNWAVGPIGFNTSASATGSYNAAIFNTSNLFSPNAGGTWVASSSLTTSHLQDSYVSSISDNYSQIIQAIPEPSTLLLATAASLFLTARRRRKLSK